MDGPMIIVLVVGSLATVAAIGATMASYKDKGSARSSRSSMLDKEYYPRYSLFPEDAQTQWYRDSTISRGDDNDEYLSARGSRDSYFNSGRNSLRNSYRHSVGGKRKSRKKI